MWYTANISTPPILSKVKYCVLTMQYVLTNKFTLAQTRNHTMHHLYSHSIRIIIAMFDVATIYVGNINLNTSSTMLLLVAAICQQKEK